MKIHKTTNYQQFSFLEYNRNVDSSKNMIKSISTNDLTAYAPIIVSPDFKIIDGQHRFIACKEMGLPVYYIVYNGNPEKAMISLNTCFRQWRQEEWLQYYIGKNVTPYIELKKYMDKYSIPLSNAILLFGKGKVNTKTFKEGKLEDYGDKKEQIAEFLNNITNVLPKSIRNYRAFVNAVMLYFYQYNPNCRSIKKLEKQIGGVGRFKSTNDIYNNIKNLMNKK